MSFSSTKKGRYENIDMTIKRETDIQFAEVGLECIIFESSTQHISPSLLSRVLHVHIDQRLLNESVCKLIVWLSA